jgi:uncharacterized membrane protein HdeD (DUF308 family)
MTNETSDTTTAIWLRNYSFVRFAFSALWVAAAFVLASGNPTLTAVLLVIYPAWDAVANIVDARRNGGFGQNRSQLINTVISTVTTVAVAWALTLNIIVVIVVFGAWAALSGILQLVTAIRRWSAGGQWAMALSGLQSALAGAFFLISAGPMETRGIAMVAGYAAFGAFYFLVSAIWLTVKGRRGRG